MNELMNELMNHKGVFKTAPATLGLLTKHGSPVGIRPNQCNPIFGNVFQNTIMPKQFQIETC